MNTKRILNITAAVLMAFCMVPTGLAAEKVTAGQIIAIKTKAKLGDAASMHNLGVCFLNGWGVAKNTAEAVKWFRKAAEKGYAEAQYNLGICYANGWGVKESEEEGVKWLRKAAKQNLKPAQDVLKEAGLTW